MRIAISLVLWCLVTASARPDCTIAPDEYVLNRTGNQCVWASLETQARHWHMTDLYDLTARHGGLAGPGDVLRAVSHRHLYWQPPGPHNWQSLQNASARHWPTSVGLQGQHMLLVLDVTPTTVTILDNSGPDAGVRQTWDRHRFDAAWDGWAVTLDPEYRSP